MSSRRNFLRVVSASLLVAIAARIRADVRTGDAFPALARAGLVSLTGGELPAVDGKVVLVDFWASWCAPCKASFPVFAQLHRDYAAGGLVIVAVSVDEKAPAALAFARKLAPPFVTVHDREQSLVRQVGAPTMPTSFLIGRDGRVRLVHEGFHGDASERELRKQIEALLAEKS